LTQVTDFELHPGLAADTLDVGSLPLSRVLLMNDARYPWLVLVPRRGGLIDLVDLDPTDHHRLTDEIRKACIALRELFRPDKLNVAALGNVVSQLHVHVIARYRNDAAWPRPVWTIGTAVPYAPAEGAERLRGLRAALGVDL